MALSSREEDDEVRIQMESLVPLGDTLQFYVEEMIAAICAVFFGFHGTFYLTSWSIRHTSEED